jgi:hypothetical protein
MHEYIVAAIISDEAVSSVFVPELDNALHQIRPTCCAARRLEWTLRTGLLSPKVQAAYLGI